MKRTRSLLRRAACLLLAVCLIAPVFCFSASAKQFTDLYRGMLSQEFMNAINYVSDNGWMNGVTSTTFAPYDEVTRGMFVTVLYRYAGSSEKYAPSFTDVSSSMYCPCIITIRSAGLPATASPAVSRRQSLSRNPSSPRSR